MRLTASLAGLFLCMVVFLGHTAQAHAEVVQPEIAFSSIHRNDAEKAAIELVTKKSQTPVEPIAVPAPTVYVVVANDTLSKVAKQFSTSWQRLYSKNQQIVSPDMLKPGESITIPLSTEELPERSMPTPVSVPVKTGSASVAPRRINLGSISGNSYIAGYCTWYVKNRRPDLPNNLGNANTWVSRAAAQGFATGTLPRVGAVGQQGMHVVYLEGVNSDGTVTVSEMNYNGFNVISSRTVAASSFQYIY